MYAIILLCAVMSSVRVVVSTVLIFFLLLFFIARFNTLSAFYFLAYRAMVYAFLSSVLVQVHIALLRARFSFTFLHYFLFEYMLLAVAAVIVVIIIAERCFFVKILFFDFVYMRFSQTRVLFPLLRSSLSFSLFISFSELALYKCKCRFLFVFLQCFLRTHTNARTLNTYNNYLSRMEHSRKKRLS